jgi:hypothetical protein
LNAHLQRCCEADGFPSIHHLLPCGTTLEFTNTKYQEHVPFAICADYEALTGKVARESEDVPTIDVNASDVIDVTDVLLVERQQQRRRLIRRTIRCTCTKNTRISVGLKLVSSVTGLLDDMPYETYTGIDATTRFLGKLLI